MELSIHRERISLHVAKYPVGIDSRVQKVISLLQKEPDSGNVLMIGIWGAGGIGKTTIASAIYNAIERQFEGRCFLERVRETSNQCDGPVKLQDKLLSQILSPNHPTVYSEVQGISLIRERLCCKKVLLVLDDVDRLDQLNALAGGVDWFGKGSRIFVTSRDKHLLVSHGINHVYEVEPLVHDEALELFGWHAFKNSEKPEIRKDLIDGALHYASGLPLALEVLGSFLYGRNKLAWESALRCLANDPNEHINQVLKISFDGLEREPREIFLDIACFFKGKSEEDIKKVLEGCGFEPTIGIDILIERSLIRNENGTLQMHDLVQLMGKNIVMQDDLGKRSRLWLFEDVLGILDEDTGKDAVQAIVLNLLTSEEISGSREEITIKVDAFKNMNRLRMLILPEMHIFSEGPVRLPNNLRWLKWPNAPLLEFGSGPKKLVGLDIQKSHIRQFGGKFKHFRTLKSINFGQCKSVVSVPDLSLAPNLERLNLDGCKSLVEVHQSVACHDKLKILSLKFCYNLSIFPHTLKAKSLQALDLFGCSKLEKFSDILEKMEHLEELDLGLTAIKELPTSVENLLSLKSINLTKCKSLTTLPSSVYKLQNLEDLNLEGCSNFLMFPKNLEDSTNPSGNPGFQNLYQLNLSGCNLSEVEFLESSSSFPKLGALNLFNNQKITHLPTCINKYDNLEHLVVANCKQLQKIPLLPPNVHDLEAKGCRSLQEFPDLSGLSTSRLLVDLSSCRELFRKGANTTDALSLEGLRKMRYADICLSGSEMPEWFLPCKGGSISFMVPGDLYEKFLGLALCFVFGPKEVDWGCGISIFVNLQEALDKERVFFLKSDGMWIKYLPRSELYHMCEGREVLRDDQNYFQVYLSTYRGRLKTCGFRPVCEQQEDELRIELPNHQRMETNWSLEERDSEEDNCIDSEEEESSRSETDDELIEAIDSSRSETDDELIEASDRENEERELSMADKTYSPFRSCHAGESGCRFVKHYFRKGFLRKERAF